MKKKTIKIGIVAIKGGVGKSLISFLISSRYAQDKHKVLLVDTDTQGTSYECVQFRKETDCPKFDAIKLFGMDVRKKVMDIQDDYDFVIIDVGASDSQSLRAAISVCDVVLTPVVPASESLWSLNDKLRPILTEMKEVCPDLEVYSFLNQAPPQGQDAAVAAEFLSSIGDIKHIKSVLRFRTAFKNSVIMGKCINELKGKYKDKKAIQEFESLFYNINRVLKQG